MPISGPLLTVKARKMQADLQECGEATQQKIAEGWGLHKFKECHGIHQLKLTGEKHSSDKSVVEVYNAEV